MYKLAFTYRIQVQITCCYLGQVSSQGLCIVSRQLRSPSACIWQYCWSEIFVAPFERDLLAGNYLRTHRYRRFRTFRNARTSLLFGYNNNASQLYLFNLSVGSLTVGCRPVRTTLQCAPVQLVLSLCDDDRHESSYEFSCFEKFRLHRFSGLNKILQSFKNI